MSVVRVSVYDGSSPGRVRLIYVVRSYLSPCESSDTVFRKPEHSHLPSRFDVRHNRENPSPAAREMSVTFGDVLLDLSNATNECSRTPFVSLFTELTLFAGRLRMNLWRSELFPHPMRAISARIDCCLRVAHGTRCRSAGFTKGDPGVTAAANR